MNLDLGRVCVYMIFIGVNFGGFWMFLDVFVMKGIKVFVGCEGDEGKKNEIIKNNLGW